MVFIDLIEKKKNNEELTYEEMSKMFSLYLDGKVPEYQMSALLMAIYFQGMTENEIFDLTKIIIESGETVNLEQIKGIKVDKHSTGGVGDSTTLILGPILASCGINFAKMSGRGLGHTGGTLDKLESIPGFDVELDIDEIIRLTNKEKIVIASQSANITPLDKRLYSLRDTTATVDSIPLIASSIMSKKLAITSDVLVLDVKVGEGAFMKSLEEARLLSNELVKIGEKFGRKTVAILTSMEQPLGRAVGNSLEVEEAIETLKGKGPKDLSELCIFFASKILELSKDIEHEEAKAIVKETISSGKAIEKLEDLIRSQKGNWKVVHDSSLLPQSKYKLEVKSDKSGYINRLPAREIGNIARDLGAGRLNIDDTLDLSAGLYIHKKCGDYIEKGEKLVTLFGKDLQVLKEKSKEYLAIVEVYDGKKKDYPLIIEEVKNGI